MTGLSRTNTVQVCNKYNITWFFFSIRPVFGLGAVFALGLRPRANTGHLSQIPGRILKTPGTIVYILVYWYSKLVAQNRWGTQLSSTISIWKGTRQGGLLSPFLFNLLYHGVMTELSCVSCGICMNDVTYNACCYADDVLLCNLTVTGLQALIDIANSYVTNHGLSFSPAKSQCATFGKNMFSTKMWHLNGVILKETDSVTYSIGCDSG